MAILKRAAAVCVLAALWGCPSTAPKRDPKAEAEGLYLAGVSSYLKGDFDKALESYKQVQALRPDDPRLPAAIGEVYLAQRKMQDALAQFRAAALAEPKRGTNWSRIGYLESTLGHRAEARDALKRALALNPKDFSALEDLGELDAKEGDLDGGVAGLVSAAKASPDDGKAALYLRAAELLRKEGRDGESMQVLTDADRAGVKSGELWTELGDEQVKAGALAEAAAAYRKAAGVLTKDPTIWELVGELELRLDHPGDAQEAFRESLKVQERALPHVAMARMCLARKDKEGAQRELELALKSATGEEKRETLELAELLVTLERKADALKLLANLAAEPEAGKDGALQLRTARLAREVGDKDVVKAACLRATDAGVRCP